MDSNLILRGLDNLFSQTTLVCFLVTLIFLYCFYKLEKYTIRIIGLKWINRMFTAWCVVMTVVVGLCQLLENLESFIRFKRFGDRPDFHFELGGTAYLILAPPVIAVLFTIYLWISPYWKRKVKDIAKIMLIEGLFVFTTLMVAMLSRQVFVGGFNSIFFAMALYIPVPAGAAMAFMLYNYDLYRSKLKIQEKELQISRLQQQLSQSQLDALSSKINPHFLYNALNSIAGLATSDGIKTRSMAIALSKLFRYNINKEESNYVRIKDELEMVLTYLEIEKIRFGDRLGYHCHIPDALKEELIPRHLLQPLVENAVKHGGSSAHLEINITLEEDEKGIRICVADNGKPFDQDFSPGYGIKSLYDKLDLLTSGCYEITFENNPKQVCISIEDHEQLL